MTVRSRQTWAALLLYVSVAVAVGFTDHRVRRFADHVVTTYIPEVVQGTAEPPGRYRVLAPFMIDAAQRAIGASPLITFLVIRLALIYAALVATHVYLRRWYDAFSAVGGTLLLAALLPLTFTNSWAHPDSMVELLLFTGGCIAIAGRRDAWFVAWLVAAAFNRETSAFLLILWAWDRLASGSWPAVWLRVAGVGALWVGITGGIRWARGFAHYQYWMLPTNLDNLIPLPANFDPYVRVSGYMWVILSLTLLGLATLGVRRCGFSSYFGRALGVACLLLATGVTISSVIESRIFTPLLPLLLPAALAGLGAASNETGSVSETPG